MPEMPPDGFRPAMADGPTATVFARYRSRALRFARGGLAAVVVGFALAPIAPGVAIEVLSGWMVVLGFPVGLLGAAKLVRLRRIGRLLDGGPWAARSASFRMAASTGPALVIHADGQRPEAVCSLFQNKLKTPVLEEGDRRPVWVAGDPTRWAVVAPPDRSNFVVVRRPVLPLSKTRLRRAATTEPASTLTAADDPRPLWLRIVTTPGGAVMIALFLGLFAFAIYVDGLSAASRGVPFGVGTAFVAVGVASQIWVRRRLAGRPTPVDEAQARAAVFVIGLVTLPFGVALAGGGLVGLLIHH